MANFYELNSNQKEYLTKRIWVFEGREPFVPTHITFLEDPEQCWYVVTFLARNQKGIQYFLSRKKVDAYFISKDRTNEWIDVLEMMSYKKQHFPPLPETIYFNLINLLK
ncbi:MAG: hypothetical protein IJY09_03165 [Lachnospiraceae bacterium]|nr:hypothetical protein [Lachnospiraceae bacterium]